MWCCYVCTRRLIDAVLLCLYVHMYVYVCVNMCRDTSSIDVACEYVYAYVDVDMCVYTCSIDEVCEYHMHM